jgi:hypothetical protein
MTRYVASLSTPDIEKAQREKLVEQKAQLTNLKSELTKCKNDVNGRDEELSHAVKEVARLRPIVGHVNTLILRAETAEGIQTPAIAFFLLVVAQFE